MQSSLIPERPLVISPTLAATIGLEEAVLLHVLTELMAHRSLQSRDGLRWVELSQQELMDALPFWALIDLRRVQKSLQELGLILLDPKGSTRDDACLYAINQRQEQGGAAPTPVSPSPAPLAQPPRAGASYIPSNWQPGEEWLRQCRQQNIPDAFVRDLVPGFVLYWRERGQARFSWGNAFFKYVLREWRAEQSRRGMAELDSEMSAHWWPSQDAMTILENAGISTGFIEDAVPEFVLYWRERGASSGAWNTRFIEHVRRQWARYSASIHHDSQPRCIPEDWQPSAECYEILRLAEIDEDFARGKVSEFVLYWRDTKQVHASWNTRFLQFIKYQWARRLVEAPNMSISHAENQSFIGKGQQEPGAALRRFTDRSWAE
ncbi:MAG: hypothetical protein H7A05_09425 [Pseudomonadales bacterium]|nr:hypothetical protein [Pseudomonadales bacterium]MCP5344829.1 hypothetical protein [Pseudomonadales bacterium]